MLPTSLRHASFVSTRARALPARNAGILANKRLLYLRDAQTRNHNPERATLTLGLCDSLSDGVVIFT